MNVKARGRFSGGAWIAIGVLLAFIVVALGVVWTFWRAPVWLASKHTQVQLYFSGIHSNSMTLDGHYLHYFEGGTGDPIVLVHGLGGSAEMNWAVLMPYLVRSGHHVFAMDLLGAGESDRPTDRTYSIAEQAKLVETFMDSKQLQKVALAGHSMGGWIAARVALDQPQRIGRLILVDSSGTVFKSKFDVAGTALLVPETTEQVDALMAILTPHPSPLPDAVKEDIVRRVKNGGWATRRALASMLTGADLLDQSFSSLKMPLLIVWGKQDALIPETVGEAMHVAAPQSVLEVYDGCGHIAVVTCADRIAPAMASFVDGKGPPAGSTIEVPLKSQP
jgi:pimeloyl-ACP methyl ester carboxylesterase